MVDSFKRTLLLIKKSFWCGLNAYKTPHHHRYLKRYSAVLKGQPRNRHGGASSKQQLIGIGEREQEQEQEQEYASEGTCVKPIGGQDAVTRWKVIKSGNGRTLVEYFPKTGRTHQLRKHSKHMRASILSDLRHHMPGEVVGEEERSNGLYLWTCGVTLPPTAVPWRGGGGGLNLSIDPPHRFFDAVAVLPE